MNLLNMTLMSRFCLVQTMTKVQTVHCSLQNTIDSLYFHQGGCKVNQGK